MGTQKLILLIVSGSFLLSFFASYSSAPLDAQEKQVEDVDSSQPDNEVEKRVLSELTELYQKGRDPNFQDDIKKLADADQAEAANRYLLRLLESALEDEHDKKSAVKLTPYWGMISVNAAKRLRADIAVELAKSEDQNGHVEIWKWFLFQETVEGARKLATASCLKAKPEHVKPIVKKVIGEVHPSYFLLSQCLADKNAIDLELDEAHIVSLCQHHVSDIRQSARQLLRKMGGPEQPAFDPVAAMKSPPVKRVMQELDDLFEDHFAADTKKLVRIEREQIDEDEKDSFSNVGLLIAESENQYDVNNFYGRTRSFDKVIKYSKGADHNKAKQLKLEDFVEQIFVMRGAGGDHRPFSERGTLSGQFESSSAGIFEFAVAHWLYRNGKIELSAKIFLPAIESVAKDSAVAEKIKLRMGVNNGHELLVEFVGNRDYKKADRIAKQVVTTYPRSPFFKTAKSLLEELPERENDFKTLLLPTAKEWAAIKAKSSRKEVIDYLCSRLRILNCFQNGQPGGIDWDSPQYREPQGLGYSAAWGSRRGGTVVINPFTELMNDLKPKDVPFLAQHLRKDWFNLSVYFWRDFHRMRQLQSTRQLVVKAINKAAGNEIVVESELWEMSKVELENKINALSEWPKKDQR